MHPIFRAFADLALDLLLLRDTSRRLPVASYSLGGALLVPCFVVALFAHGFAVLVPLAILILLIYLASQARGLRAGTALVIGYCSISIATDALAILVRTVDPRLAEVGTDGAGWLELVALLVMVGRYWQFRFHGQQGSTR